MQIGVNSVTPGYTAGWKKTIDVEESVFCSTVWDELTRIKNSFFENIHFFSNFSYPICQYECGIQINYPQNFQTPLSSELFFQPIRILNHEYMFEAEPSTSGWVRHSWQSWKLQIHLISSNVWSAKKKIQVREKFTALLKILFKIFNF